MALQQDGEDTGSKLWETSFKAIETEIDQHSASAGGRMSPLDAPTVRLAQIKGRLDRGPGKQYIAGPAQPIHQNARTVPQGDEGMGPES
jgi:hypothetical protein